MTFLQEKTIEMAKFVYVQVRDVESLTRIFADKVEEQGTGTDAVLILQYRTEQVGKFKSSFVLGWWIADEP
jgi:hypothetical protein